MLFVFGSNDVRLLSMLLDQNSPMGLPIGVEGYQISSDRDRLDVDMIFHFLSESRTGLQAFRGPLLSVRSTIHCASASTTATHKSASHESSRIGRRSHSWQTSSFSSRIVAKGFQSGSC